MLEHGDAAGAEAPANAGANEACASAREQSDIVRRLCQYYLRCIAFDAPEIGAYATSRFDKLDYIPVTCTLDVPELYGSLRQPPVSNWLAKVAGDRSKAVFFGYPVFVEQTPTGPKLWPILLFSIDPQSQECDDFPVLNCGAIKRLPRVNDGDAIDEAVHLLNELGLAALPEQLPDFQTIIARLPDARPQWPWNEPLAPGALSADSTLPGLTPGRIYNRAALFARERPNFTAGLEIELDQLARIDPQLLRGTALGYWVGQRQGSECAQPDLLLEPLPLNTEQRQAVHTALTQPLTVITGPPGTGKSQLVAAIIVNASRRGETVLLASRNNKAVDIVEARSNSLAERPAVLRLGDARQLGDVSVSVDGMLAAAVDPSDAARIEEAQAAHELIKRRIAELDRELAKIVELRNEVQALAARCERLRERIGDGRFRRLSGAPVSEWQAKIRNAQRQLTRACRASQPAVVRFGWPLLRGSRLRRAAKALADLVDVASLVGMPLCEPSLDAAAAEHQRISEDLDEMSVLIETADAYWRRSRALAEGPSPPDVARARLKAVVDLAENSRCLWQLSLKTVPARLSAGEREALGDFNGALKLIIRSRAGGDRTTGAAKALWRQYYRAFPRTLATLRCWCITNLRARGLPLAPRLFDLVVIDEASQSDIASALPLLYRAKRAVIIGDVMQLPHITAIPDQQDAHVMSTFGIQAGWGYSANSLFDRAVGLVESQSVINLRDHFRSVAEIINFANAEFYGARLRVATRYEFLKVRLEPAVRWIDVPGRVTKTDKEGIGNHAEALQVVEQLKQLLASEEFRGTIGVVTPFRAQKEKIISLIQENAALARSLAALDFLCHTAHGFQGDERDVMIFSPVIAPGIEEGSKWFLSSRNLFNVAITRARGGLIVVGDRTAARQSGIHHLQRLVDYIDSLGGKQQNARLADVIVCPAEHPIMDDQAVSEWERLLYRAICARNLRPVPQYRIDKYRLDFALFADDRKLDIEVDGEHYHRAWDGSLVYQDQLRNQRLIELGWDVMRFWVWQVRDDLDGVVDRILAWAALGKQPKAT